MDVIDLYVTCIWNYQKKNLRNNYQKNWFWWSYEIVVACANLHVDIIFFTFISWFPDGYTIRNPFTFLDMACRQESIPVGQPSGEMDLSWHWAPVGVFLTVSRQE